MHRRRTALRALCGGGVLAARGTAGRKAGRCAGCYARYLGAYLRFGRAAWQCGCDLRGSHLRSGGLSRRVWRLRDLRRVALRQAVASAQAARQSAARNGVGRAAWQCGCDMRGSHLRSGGLSRRVWRLRDLRRVALRQAVASAPAARQSAARTCIGSATWPTRRALCSGLIDAQAGYRAACGGYTICGAFVLSQSVASTQAARQSAARTGISMVEWPTRRARYTRHIALRRVIAPHVAVTRSAARRHAVRPAHRAQPCGG